MKKTRQEAGKQFLVQYNTVLNCPLPYSRHLYGRCDAALRTTQALAFNRGVNARIAGLNDPGRSLTGSRAC